MYQPAWGAVQALARQKPGFSTDCRERIVEGLWTSLGEDIQVIDFYDFLHACPENVQTQHHASDTAWNFARRLQRAGCDAFRRRTNG
ncbi:hypothetical protein [Cupriavidus necator]|uniref:hypothetical protein n=1 Tax=Cupriavidus necator TaxID=106590 RepID=UPI0009C2F034|nr:hypothetical protein [Cupriavidus necator]